MQKTTRGLVHPKLSKLAEILMEHFNRFGQAAAAATAGEEEGEDCGGGGGRGGSGGSSSSRSSTKKNVDNTCNGGGRVIVFTHKRASVKTICQHLKVRCFGACTQDPSLKHIRNTHTR